MSAGDNTPLGKMLSDWMATFENFYDQDLLATLKRYAANSPPPEMVDVIYQMASTCQATGLDIPRVRLPPMLRFPADHGDHYDTPIEWRYFTLSLELSDGSTLSLICNLFRKAIATAATAPDARPIERQIYSTSLAWTWQKASGEVVHYTIPNRAYWGGDDRVSVQTDPFRYVVGPYSIISDFIDGGPGDDIFPLTISVLDDETGGDRPSLSVDVRCEATNPLFEQGIDGFEGRPVDKPGQPALGTYYYSWHQQRTTGQVVIGGETLSVVSGRTWMDHQWGGTAAPDSPIKPPWGGWIWFEFQFDDGRSITCSAVHGDLVEHPLVGPQPGFGILVHKGVSHSLKCEVLVEDYVQSTETKARYPCAWKITAQNARFDETRPKPIELVIKPTPVMDNQILWQTWHTGEYYEGAAVVEAAGLIDGEVVALRGVGYCEGTGFQDPHKRDAHCMNVLENWPD